MMIKHLQKNIKIGNTIKRKISYLKNSINYKNNNKRKKIEEKLNKLIK